MNNDRYRNIQFRRQEAQLERLEKEKSRKAYLAGLRKKSDEELFDTIVHHSKWFSPEYEAKDCMSELHGRDITAERVVHLEGGVRGKKERKGVKLLKAGIIGSCIGYAVTWFIGPAYLPFLIGAGALVGLLKSFWGELNRRQTRKALGQQLRELMAQKQKSTTERKGAVETCIQCKKAACSDCIHEVVGGLICSTCLAAIIRNADLSEKKLNELPPRNRAKMAYYAAANLKAIQTIATLRRTDDLRDAFRFAADFYDYTIRFYRELDGPPPPDDLIEAMQDMARGCREISRESRDDASKSWPIVETVHRNFAGGFYNDFANSPKE